jgi:hypothetical protein
MAPEFYFHGLLGPYVFSPAAATTSYLQPQEEAERSADSPLEVTPNDPMIEIQRQLTAAFNNKAYPNWMFVFGTAITAEVRNISNALYDEQTQVRNRVVQLLAKECLSTFGTVRGSLIGMIQDFIATCHAYPVLMVRGRAPIHSNIGTPPGKLPTDQMTTEKFSMSSEDLVLYDPNGGAVTKVITEQMVAYQMIDLYSGDLKRKRDDPYAIFRQYYGEDSLSGYMDFAVEICLDHLNYRLRKGIGRQPFPFIRDAVHVQLIPSCGTSILPGAVATDADGYVFNCDGQATIGSKNYGKCQLGTTNDNFANMNCLYTDNSAGGAHTQLARVLTPAVGGNPSLGTDATFYSNLLPSTASCLPVTIPPGCEPNVGQYFAAAGPGEVHIYGLTEPYLLYGPERAPGSGLAGIQH